MSDNTAHVSALVLLGDTRRGALLAALTDIVTVWQQHWSTHRSAIQVTMGEVAVSQSNTSLVTYLTARSGTNQPLLQLLAATNCLPALLGVTGDASEVAATADTAGMAKDLQTVVLKSLCNDVLTRCQIKDVVMDATSCSSPLLGQRERRNWWQIDIRLQSQLPLLCLRLHSSVVELLAPRRPRAAVPTTLERKRTAVADELVRVEAVLGELEVTLLDLASLAEGDVLLLDQPLTQPGFLTLQNGARVANIYLGSATPYRAVRVSK